MQPDVREHIAAEVRAELARQSKSQRDLADALDLPQSAVWQRLRGNRSFRAEELAAVADYLGVPMASFLPAEAEGLGACRMSANSTPPGTPRPSAPPPTPRPPSGPTQPTPPARNEQRPAVAPAGR